MISSLQSVAGDIKEKVSRRESETFQIEARLDGDWVRSAAQIAETFAAQAGIVHDDRARLRIIVEELIGNLADYQSGSDPPTLALMRQPSAIALTLTDCGEVFDPRLRSTAPVPDRGGGAGLDLVRAWARIVEYRRIRGCNRLELIIPLKHPSGLDEQSRKQP